MKELRPSRTALGVALQRAAHQFLDNPKVFNDPLALRIIGPEQARELQADPQKVLMSPSFVRGFVSARSHFSEEQLTLAVERGVRQYVILGAGLDTFAYRNPYPPGLLRIFEVDHPATQLWKQERLKENTIPIPSDLKFISVDFERQKLNDALQKAGHDPGLPTFFSFLGVSYYLKSDSLMETLQFIASSSKGSSVVFDYAIFSSLLPRDQKVNFENMLLLFESIGEPWQTLFRPEELTQLMYDLGFTFVDNLTPDAINKRFFSEHNSELRVPDHSYLMNAGKL